MATALDDRKHLEQFVVHNDDLQELEARIGKFNIFDALGITRAEIRHSNFLAFILDPAESHGQGQRFLKALLMDLFRDAPQSFPVSAIDIDGTDLRGVEVRREWKLLDLLITSKEPRFAVVIENKVDAQEHSNQLARYRRVMQEHFSDTPTMFVFLTATGQEASDAVWKAYSYQALYEVLRRARSTHQGAIGGDVLVFLDHYLGLLGTRFMNDDVIDQLCRRIYKNHRHALQLIWDRVGSPAVGPIEEVKSILETDSRWQVLHRSTSYVDMMPTEWATWIPHYSVCVHIKAGKRKLWYAIIVGQVPQVSNERRKEIVNSLRQACPSIGFSPTKAGEAKDAKISRICEYETISALGGDDDVDPDAIRTRAQQKLDQLYPKLQKLEIALKPLMAPEQNATQDRAGEG